MLICLIFPIYTNNLLLDTHYYILKQFFNYDSCICSKQNKYQLQRLLKGLLKIT